MRSITPNSKSQNSDSTPIQLDEKQKSLVRNALRVARDRFVQDETSMRSAATAVVEVVSSDGTAVARSPNAFLSVAERFKQQAADTLVLLDLLDGKEIILTDEEGYNEEDARPNLRP